MTHAPRVAAFFDLDKTVIARNGRQTPRRPFGQQGLINRRAALKDAYARLMATPAGADGDQIERISSLCEGWDVEQVRAIVEETLHDTASPLVYAEAADLLSRHRDQGHDVVVVSASGEEIVTPLARMIGATHGVGSRMGAAHGRYTGEIEFYCHGDNKALAIRRLAKERDYDLPACHAYSDSIADLPMLDAVGHPAAVNPDRGLREIAVERDWPVLTFSKQVSLRARIPTPSGTAVAVTAVGLGAAVAAGATWYGLRRRRKR